MSKHLFGSAVIALALAAPAYARDADRPKPCLQHDGDYYVAGEGFASRHRHGDGYDDFRPCHLGQMGQANRDRGHDKPVTRQTKRPPTGRP